MSFPKAKLHQCCFATVVNTVDGLNSTCGKMFWIVLPRYTAYHSSFRVNRVLVYSSYSTEHTL